jgi:hypothetical protein
MRIIKEYKHILPRILFNISQRLWVFYGKRFTGLDPAGTFTFTPDQSGTSTFTPDQSGTSTFTPDKRQPLAGRLRKKDGF